MYLTLECLATLGLIPSTAKPKMSKCVSTVTRLLPLGPSPVSESSLVYV